MRFNASLLVAALPLLCACGVHAAGERQPLPAAAAADSRRQLQSILEFLFSFARHGIPSLWISAGEDDASGRRKYSAFWKTDYHTVRDEYHADWPLAALEQTVQAAVALVVKLDRAQPPRWKGKLPFPQLR